MSSKVIKTVGALRHRLKGIQIDSHNPVPDINKDVYTAAKS